MVEILKAFSQSGSNEDLLMEPEPQQVHRDGPFKKADTKSNKRKRGDSVDDIADEAQPFSKVSKTESPSYRK